MSLLNPWFIGSLGFLFIWFVIWMARKKLRKEMVWASLLTMPFGLFEPFFVPEYWSPPSLFNLAITTGFDIESFIFAFAFGGVGSVLYEFLTNKRHKKIRKYKRDSRKYKFHLFAILSMPLILILLIIFTDLNPIYSAIIAMFVSTILAVICRHDLKNRVWIGGVSFSMLYFLFFLLINLIYPTFVQNVWNLEAISGILIIGVPLEELLFAFTFGMLWSTIYEHVNWYK